MLFPLAFPCVFHRICGVFDAPARVCLAPAGQGWVPVRQRVQGCPFCYGCRKIVRPGRAFAFSGRFGHFLSVHFESPPNEIPLGANEISLGRNEFSSKPVSNVFECAPTITRGQANTLRPHSFPHPPHPQGFFLAPHHLQRALHTRSPQR